MIFLSLVLVIVAAVTLVLGVFQDGLVLIYVSIATCVAAMAVLGAGVLLRRREEASALPTGYAGATPAVESSDSRIARTPQADAPEVTPAAERTAVVRKVEADPAAREDRSSAGAAAGAAAVGAAGAVAAGAAATRRDPDGDSTPSPRPVGKRAVVRRARVDGPAGESTGSSPGAAADAPSASSRAVPWRVARTRHLRRLRPASRRLRSGRYPSRRKRA